jgi:hypothetical protein
MTGKWRPDRQSGGFAGDGQGWIIEDDELPRLEPLRPGRTPLKRSAIPEASVGSPEIERGWARNPERDGDGDVEVRAPRVEETDDRMADPSAREPRPGRTRDREISLRDAVPADEIARIGKRGRLRPELFVVILGAVFVAAALLKPWPNPPRSATPSSPTSALALLPSGAESTAPLSLTTPPESPATQPEPSPTVNIWALIPPYNYRPGQWPPPTTGPATGGTAQSAGGAWQSVDWSFLAQQDTHTSWGVAALSVPTAVQNNQPVPSLDWVPEVAPWSPSTLYVPGGSSVYGIALTWPDSLRVSSVTFDYLNLANPRVDVTPVPAAAVATPGPDSTAPAPSPTPQQKRPAGLTSGSFWIAPSSDLVSPTPSSLSAAWRASPWSWPTGMYRATLATNAGTMIVVLELRQLG